MIAELFVGIFCRLARFLDSAHHLQHSIVMIKKHDVVVMGGTKRGLYQAVACARMGAQTAFCYSCSLDGADEVSLREDQLGLLASENITLISANAESLFDSSVILLQLETHPDLIKKAIEHSEHGGISIVLDPSPLPSDGFPVGCLNNINVIKVNTAEAVKLVGIVPENRDAARAVADKLITLGVKNVLIEAGKEGSLLVTHDQKELWLSFEPLSFSEMVDTTLVGALAASLASGKDMFHSALFAHAAAVLMAGRSPAINSIPLVDEVLEALNQFHGKTIFPSADTAA
jgi:sugar/nucleoside kinase (ribokinase family)